MDPSEVDYVNVHGTSTPLGDMWQKRKPFRVCFGDHAYELEHLFDEVDDRSSAGRRRSD